MVVPTWPIGSVWTYAPHYVGWQQEKSKKSKIYASPRQVTDLTREKLSLQLERSAVQSSPPSPVPILLRGH